MDTGLRRYDGEGVNNMDFVLRFVNDASMHHCSDLCQYDGEVGIAYQQLRFLKAPHPSPLPRWGEGVVHASLQVFPEIKVFTAN